MNTPWTDALASLRAQLPDAENQEPTTQQTASAPTAETNPYAGLCARVTFERKGRGGKPATIIYGLDTLSEQQLRTLASQIKQKLAVGGSASAGEILLQGDQRPKLKTLLPTLGFKSRFDN